MIKKFMQRLGRYRIIMDRESNEPLLERYYVFLKDRTWFPFNIFVHKFCKGDPGDIHDHPWPYFTLILRGGYYEWVGEFNSAGEKVGEVRHWRRPGHFRFCGASSYHRIELVDGITPWTLFIPGPQQREWGFLVNGTWVHNDKYLAEKARQPN